jgi:phage terminase large subunit GpA-like protein
VLEEGRDKLYMVENGRWRPTKPEVKKHHGYRLNALNSLLTNASWGKLAGEFLKAKRGGPAELQVFVNTILAETWKTSLNRLEADVLRGRTEAFGLESIPAPVVLLTVGADVQDDRIEATILGWPPEGSPYVLAHHTIDGNTLDDETWARFDGWLQRRYQHPHGWPMEIDATAIDSGGSEGRTQKVYDFCGRRFRRRVFAIKGAAGARPLWARAQKVKKFARLFIVGHDQVKTEVMERLAREPFDEEGNVDIHAIRISDDLPDDWFEQVTGEKRMIRYVRNRAVIEFMPKRSGQRVEALDSLCYGWAVRFSPSVKAIDLKERAARKPIAKGEKPSKRKGIADWAAALNR